MANVHLTREQKDELLNKVKIGGENVQSVNFIENKVVQEGLVVQEINKNINGYRCQPNLSNTDDFTIMITNNLKSKNSFSTIVFQNKATASGSTLDFRFKDLGNSYLVSVWVSGTDTVELISNRYPRYFGIQRINNIYYIFDDQTIKKVGTTAISIDLSNIYIGNPNFSVDVTGSVSVIIHNKQLTQKEIQHNFNVLSNAPSISKINDYTISTDTDHIIDRGEKTQESINRVFYKNMCKEFTSNGGDIVVNNGMDGYVLSATLQGQTVKNIAYPTDTLKTITTTIDVKLSELSVEGIVNNTYTIAFYATNVQSGASVKANLDNGWFGSFFPQNAVQVKEGLNVFTITPTSLYVGKKALQVKAFTGSFDASYGMVFEGDVSKYITGKAPFGLSSTQAVISNNNLKYSFYKDSVDKASGTVLTLGGVGGVVDTWEIKEDGNGVYTKSFNVDNVIEVASISSDSVQWVSIWKKNDALSKTNSVVEKIVFEKYSGVVNTSSNHNLYYLSFPLNTFTTVEEAQAYFNNSKFAYQLKIPVVTPVPKELVPTILTQLQNTFTFGEGVAPTSVTIKAPVTDGITKSYTVSLLNAYTQTVGTATPVVDLLKDGKVRLQMDLTAPSIGMNTTLFTVAPELRPVTNQRIPIFVNGVCVLGVVDKTTGNVNLVSIPSANANIYIKTDYRRDI